ncbi:MAG TPA: Sip1-related alpha-galactosidase, partial [Polyangiaceae bacterium]|nr:Sip1-related alpha-galactosidase [Polyangiaceae bacterium]
GTLLAEVPAESQFVLAELTGGGWLLCVPLLDEPFRFSLRGHAEGRLELLAETGDPHQAGFGGVGLFVASGEDPFELVTRGARAVARRLGSRCRLRSEKAVPDFVGSWGWCTWDAFYQEVSAEKLRAGLAAFQASGVMPGFVILDDGWQTERLLPTGERRLTSFRANEKFGGDLRPCIREAKQDFGVRTFLVWHAVLGYWGGVDPEGLPGYSVVEQPRRFGEGILTHTPRCNEEWWGSLVGLVPESEIGRFYDDYHRQLAEQGVDGVKVDNQAVLESLGARQGGRVRLNRRYREALESSVERHFEGRLINCMASAQETYYGSPGSTLTRTSIDFFPRRPESHSAHLYANAQVGLWFGQFMQPDWDMFQSGHEWGAFHAAGRALSGGPVYLSDQPGEHDGELLRKLVCSDGSVLRGDGPGLPTQDTLCVDPTRERLPLKIWNRSGTAGMLGVFHALYAAGQAEPVSGSVQASDVPGLEGERFACYEHNAQRLSVLTRTETRSISLREREFELFSLVPIEHGFAALGLADKFNGPAALRAIHWLGRDQCRLVLADSGEFLAYAERPPHRVQAGAEALAFRYDRASRALRVRLGPGPSRELVLAW